MASRKEQKERLRAERLEREQQAQAVERRKRLVGYGVSGVLALAAIVAVVVVLASDGGGGGAEAAGGEFPEGSAPPEQITELQEAVRAADCELEQTRDEGNEHVEEGTRVEYKANPPTSGDHLIVPAEDGAYTEPQPTEALVHSLEHGRILIQYDPSVPDSVKGGLKALYDEDPYHMILSPNDTDMPFEVAATTWTRSLGCPEMNPQVFDAIRAFRNEYRDEGPEFVP
jgi:uncharacterized protein DUF3105